MKKTFVAGLGLLCALSLQAKEYVITPEESEVLGTVRTLTNEEMLVMIAGSEAGEDKFYLACKKYMAAVITVKNDSAQTIILKRDRYLENSDDYFAIKEHLAIVYESYFKSKKSQLILSSIGGWASLIASTIRIIDSRDHWEDENFSSILGTILCGLGTAVLCKMSLKTLSNVLYVGQKQTTLFRKQTYIIPPGKTFQQFFLVDLTHASRDIFDKTPPKLVYKTQTTKTRRSL